MTTAITPAEVYTALVTPFLDDDTTQALDLPALDRLVDRQLGGGVDGIVACGTTGEAPALSPEEQVTVIKHVAKRAHAKAFVVAGTGTNSTRTTIEHSLAALKAGAEAVMVVVPYYSKPTQDGLARHFVTVAKALPCEVIIYNIPGRTGVDLLPDTLERILSDAHNVVAMKEATGNVLRAQELVHRFGVRLRVLSGDDALTLPMMAVGARGVISVTSNLLPADVVRLVKLVDAADGLAARALHRALMPVHEAMFLESNPAPVKAALAMTGIMTDAVRGPLVAASPATRARIQAVLEAYKLGAV